MIIIGAGLAGLLAARCLSHYRPTVVEVQDELPNNHSALLRFRTNIVGERFGIPFKKVNVYKGVLLQDGRISNTATIAEFNAYSYKTTGQVSERSIINLDGAVRYIAPPRLISLLADNADIKFGTYAQDFLSWSNRSELKEPIISTIPMPVLMDILEYPKPCRFEQRTIWTINLFLNGIDVYQTLYLPYDRNAPYRITITGNKVTFELSHEHEEWSLLPYIEKYMAIIFPEQHHHIMDIELKKQDYGKIVPIDEYERQKFMLWATDQHGIYSLGRYATWRQILLDDVMKDIAVINRFIEQRNSYQRAIHYRKETTS